MEILFTFKIKAQQEADLLRRFPTYYFIFQPQRIAKKSKAQM